MAALRAEAYDVARQELLALASDCRSGRHGRQALLLLAAAELDTGNAGASPRMAAYLSASYLLLPDAAPEDVPLARALYRLGVDLTPLWGSTSEAGPMPAVASRFDVCDPRAFVAWGTPLPATPPPGVASSTTLRQELAARSDSLDLLRARIGVQSRTIAELNAEVDELNRAVGELNAEIDRIMELLKSGRTDASRRDGT